MNSARADIIRQRELAVIDSVIDSFDMRTYRAYISYVYTYLSAVCVLPSRLTCVHIAVIYSVIDSMIDSVIADGGGEVAVTAATKAEVELEGIEAKEPKGDGGGDGAQWQQGDGGAGAGAEEGRRGAPRSVGKKRAASACISTH